MNRRSDKKPRPLGRGVSFTIGLLIMSLIAVPAMAENETVNQTVPVIISFTSAQAYGENPVQIIDNSTGFHAFIGNTSSRNIPLEPDRGYYLRVESAGLTDAANNPDSGLIGMTEWVGRNPIGCVGFSLLFGVFISAIQRRRK